MGQRAEKEEKGKRREKRKGMEGRGMSLVRNGCVDGCVDGCEVGCLRISEY